MAVHWTHPLFMTPLTHSYEVSTSLLCHCSVTEFNSNLACSLSLFKSWTDQESHGDVKNKIRLSRIK